LWGLTRHFIIPRPGLLRFIPTRRGVHSPVARRTWTDPYSRFLSNRRIVDAVLFSIARGESYVELCCSKSHDLFKERTIVESPGTAAHNLTLRNQGERLGSGRSIDEILVNYPYTERENIIQALRYAAWRVEERGV
jgi:hypothetical protein